MLTIKKNTPTVIIHAVLMSSNISVFNHSICRKRQVAGLTAFYFVVADLAKVEV
jgi:hypothetical protein